MKQYKIWNLIKSCQYKSSKSYGVENTGDVSIFVGTSSRNSFHFANHATTHRLLENGDREFRFYFNGKCIKRVLLTKGATKLKKLSVKGVK